jgi:hypothetical protein
VSLWHCLTHGMSGPRACCLQASRAEVFTSEIFPGVHFEPSSEMTVTTWFEAPADPDDPMQWPTITRAP